MNDWKKNVHIRIKKKTTLSNFILFFLLSFFIR